MAGARWGEEGWERQVPRGLLLPPAGGQVRGVPLPSESGVLVGTHREWYSSGSCTQKPLLWGVLGLAEDPRWLQLGDTLPPWSLSWQTRLGTLLLLRGLFRRLLVRLALARLLVEPPPGISLTQPPPLGSRDQPFFRSSTSRPHILLFIPLEL